MRAKLTRICAAGIVAIITAFCLIIPVAALDDTYHMEDIGITMKFPKGDYVITRDTPRGDEVFDAVNLDYDETMTAFKAANIYLRAYDPEDVYQISLIVTQNADTEAVNNYSDLNEAERKEILDTFQSDESIKSAVEIKHNDTIFFDTERETTIDDETVYINQCHTVVNGMQIDLMLQKSEEEITAEEALQLTNAANSMTFDKVQTSPSGPAFDWWRLLLWIVILVAISIAVSFVYKQYRAANQRKMEARRQRHNTTLADYEEARHAEEEPEMTFEESLGYKDEEEFTSRAAADEMAGTDISVQEKDPNKGINFFEDEGEGIDDGTDYFDTFFKEPVEQRSPVQRFFSAIWSYIKIGATHTGYFFKNLYLKLVAKIKGIKKR